MSTQPTILLADDDDVFCEDLRIDLERHGYEIKRVQSSLELRRIVQDRSFGVILLDLNMPDTAGRMSEIAGLEDLGFFKSELRLQETEIIVLCAFTSERIKKEAMRRGAFDFITKHSMARDRKPLLQAIGGAFAQIKTIAARGAREFGVEVRPTLQFSVVPTAFCLQFGSDPFTDGLIKYTIANNTNRSITVSITTWIEDKSDPDDSTVKVHAEGVVYITSSPVMRLDHVSAIRDVENATLRYVVTYVLGGRRLKEKGALKIQMHPMNTMCWALENAETSRSYYMADYLAGWVTPRTKSVESMVLAARRYHQQNVILGYEGTHVPDAFTQAAMTREQIKAMYDALKHETRLAYVAGGGVTYRGRGSHALQRVRLPDETLERGAASCIDASVLFASLIESADMHPVIVLIPGHAFVGWETGKGSGQFEYLETSLIDTAEFETANERACDQHEAVKAQGGFDLGSCSTISIEQCRQARIYPMVTR